MTTNTLMMKFGFVLAVGTAAGCMGGGDDSGPATCSDAKSAYGVATDGPQTLYFGGDKSMPWSAYCVGMASDSPVEFVELPQYDANGRAANYSTFSQADTAQPPSELLAQHDGFTIVTHYEKVRIDPATLNLDITNKAFTRTDAPTNDSGSWVSVPLGNLAINYMPFGVAMQCGAQRNSDSSVVGADANINLGGLPFELADEQICATGQNTFVRDSTNPAKAVALHALGVTSSTTMTCGRASVHCLPDPTANGQVGGQTTIPLRYVGTSSGFGF